MKDTLSINSLHGICHFKVNNFKNENTSLIKTNLSKFKSTSNGTVCQLDRIRAGRWSFTHRFNWDKGVHYRGTITPTKNKLAGRSRLLSFFSKYQNYRLVSLDLSRCGLNDEKFKELLEVTDVLDYLEEFNCYGNNLTNECSTRLSNFLEFCPELKIIEFGSNPEITHQGAEKIIDGINNSGARIERINFDGITITPLENEDLNETIERIKQSMDISYR